MKKLTLITLLFSQITLAQNLLSNGSFASDISSWTNEYPGEFQIAWVADDGNLSNGSLELKTMSNSNGVNIAESERIEIIKGKTYHLQAWVKPSLDTDTEGANLWINWYIDDRDWPVGNTQTLFVFTSTANGQWTKIEGDFLFPDDITSISIVPGVQVMENTNNTASSVRFDDISLTLKSDDPKAFAMLPGHSALWYNRSQDGHGFNVYMLAEQRVVVIWYVYDNSGNPLWLLGVGTHDGFKATIDVGIYKDAMFPPDFDPDDVNRVDWGGFELEFSGCDAGHIKWIPNAGNGFDAGEMDLVRLNTTLGLSCTE